VPAALAMMVRAPIIVLGLASLLSLVAVFWPVWRGVPWSQVRQEIGLSFAARPLRDATLGLATYLMALPLAAVGIVVMLLLMRLQGALAGGKEPAPPSHPITEIVEQAGWPVVLQIFFLACVAAPIVEETMFRGVLYRHLREASRGLGTASSFVVSATVVSFIFAAIHPQGVLGISVLMGLAYAFALAREWRGSLLPSMVAHGITNGIALLIATLLLGD
jgi:membrane protease YdiL (CAAX protease family)